MTNKKKTFKCIYCSKQYMDKSSLYNHMEKEHSDMIPKDMSPAQHLFNIRNKKTHGTCIMCGSETKWNEQTEKYERICSVTCKEEYREQFKNRMMDKHGKVHLLNDPVQQRKMLENRKISGKYKWSDGREITYTGSYEKDFFKFLDLVMNFSSNDVLAPAPQTFYYTMSDGIKRFYVPDVFIPSLNLLVEIKDGGSNPNNHPKIQAVDKAKEREKDKVMKSQKKHNYLKITNKDYSSFLNFLMELKNQDASKEEDIRPIVRISETYNFLTNFQRKHQDLIVRESCDDNFINILKRFDLDGMLSENNIVDNSYTIEKIDQENIVSENFGLPNERKFLINSKDNVTKAIRNFRFCERTKRKELARNIFKKANEFQVTIPKVSPIWEHVSPEDLILKEECCKIGKDRTIDYSIIEEYPEITTILNRADNIWISSDYHLFHTKRKNLHLKQKVTNVNSLIEKNHNKLVKENDVFIFLGDLVNDEFEDQEALKQYIKGLNGRKILVLGNNDIFDESFYYECGFESVVNSFRYKEFVFTHYPVDIQPNEINIHGHIHFSKQYYDISCENHIDAYCDAHGYKPVKLEKMLELFEQGYYDGQTIRNGDFTLVNKLHQESSDEFERIRQYKKDVTSNSAGIKIFSLLGRTYKATVDIVKGTKDDKGGFYACNYGRIVVSDDNNSDVEIPTYIIGYKGEDTLDKGEDVSIRVIGLLKGETEDDIALVGQFLYNRHEYTDFEVLNLIYMQERHKNRSFYKYNKEIRTPIYVDKELPEYDIESEEFLEKLVESFNIDADGNILIKLRQKSDFMTKYQTSHKLLKIYKDTNNIEGIKHQLCKLWYMIVIIETYYAKPENVNPITRKLSEKNREEALKAKGFIMNDFTYYLKFVIQRDQNFDFEAYFAETEYYNDLIKIDTKGVSQLIKNLLFGLI